MRTVRHLRPASASDIPALESCEAAWRASLANRRGGSVWLARFPNLLPFEALVAAGRVLVATGAHGDPGLGQAAPDGNVDILACCVLEPGPPGVTTVWHLYAPDDSAGDDLLAYARALARAAGVPELWVVAFPGDRAGKSRCENLHLTAGLLLMAGSTSSRPRR